MRERSLAFVWFPLLAAALAFPVGGCGSDSGPSSGGAGGSSAGGAGGSSGYGGTGGSSGYGGTGGTSAGGTGGSSGSAGTGGSSGGTGGSGGGNYTPLVVDDFENGTDGQDPNWPASTGGPMTYDSAHAHSGKLAIKVHFRDGVNGYGGYQNLSKAVTPGETVWYRIYLYMPSTLSLSYGDVSGDGFGWNKFLVLAKYGHDSPRMYVQPRSAYKVDYGQSGFYGTGLYVNHDSLGSGYCKLQQNTYTFPRDKWFALQMAWHVATDSTAWVRVWSDDTFLGQCDGAGQVPSGYNVQSWGIGDYWNGGAWIKNGSTADFWIDDAVVTVETPDTTDSGGRPYISPSSF